MRNTRDQIAGTIRAEIARRGLSAAAVAAHMGTNKNYISRRLRGQVAFDTDDLTRIADFLGLSLTALIADSERVA